MKHGPFVLFLSLQFVYCCIFLISVDFNFFFNPKKSGRVLVFLRFNHQVTSFILIPGKTIDQVLLEDFSRPRNEKVVTEKIWVYRG